MNNNSNITIQSCDDNKIVINGKEYFGFGITNVFVGDFPDVERFDAEGNLNPTGTFTKDTHGVLIKITADLFTDVKEVYNLSTQKHHNWVLIDLETGRGGGWYPGSRQYCYTLTENTMIKKEASDLADTALHLAAKNSRLEILNNIYESNNELWYEVTRNDIKGFIKATEVSAVEFNNY